MAIVLLCIVILMKVFDKLGDDAFAELVIALFAVYCGSNVVGKFVNHGNGKTPQEGGEK